MTLITWSRPLRRVQDTDAPELDLELELEAVKSARVTRAPECAASQRAERDVARRRARGACCMARGSETR